MDDDKCPVLVGVMPGSRLMGFHSTSTRNNGLHDLVMQRTMVHGETEFSTWVFNRAVRTIMAANPTARRFVEREK